MKRLVCPLTALALFGAVSGPALARTPTFRVGAAVGDFTPPAQGKLKPDPADCPQGAGMTGPRPFVFIEPYTDSNGNGVYDLNEPYADCNGNERWDGNLIGGGSNNPRYYDHVADPVQARAMVVSNGKKTFAVEALDNEGAFNVYLERIRAQVAKDGVHLDGIFISSTHDESAPDTIGLGGLQLGLSGVDAYFADYMVDKSAKAIEQAYRAMRPARIRFAEAREPANLRQCWSSYPFVDDELMPVIQAVGSNGRAIATMASVSQHAETLGFNKDPVQARWLSGDWPHFFRDALEHRFGGVGIEMAGSVGSVETPEVFGSALSRVPQKEIDESHPAGCRTLFKAKGKQMATGYAKETRSLGLQLAGAVSSAVRRSGKFTRSNTMWGDRADVCFAFTNALFKAAGALGTFAERPGYSQNCTVEVKPLANGVVAGDEVKTQVAAFRIGDGEFISLPGEVFPFTYMRSFIGPQDLPHPEKDQLPPWLFAHMHTPYRFFDGLAEDMVGYVFPQGNGVGIPGEDPSNPSADDTDRFGCGHSDDSESAGSAMGDALGNRLVKLLDAHGRAETIVTGRYVLGNGKLSRDPLGGPELKCKQDNVFKRARPAVAVWQRGKVVRPAAWMSLSGRRQSSPDRDTRGYMTRSGKRVWLEVFPEIPGAPSRVKPGP